MSFKTKAMHWLSCDKCGAEGPTFSTPTEAITASPGWLSMGWFHYCPQHAEEFLAAAVVSPPVRE